MLVWQLPRKPDSDQKDHGHCLYSHNPFLTNLHRTEPLPGRRYDIDLRDERELALQRLKRICQSSFVSVTDFR